MLNFKLLPVDCRAVEAGRRSGLEPPKRKARRIQTLGERDRGRIAEAPGRGSLVAEMDNSAQERAGGEHNRPARD